MTAEKRNRLEERCPGPLHDWRNWRRRMDYQPAAKEAGVTHTEALWEASLETPWLDSMSCGPDVPDTPRRRIDAFILKRRELRGFGRSSSDGACSESSRRT